MCEITKENDSLQRQTENKDEDSHVPPIKKNVPELRFPEFEGEWKEVQIKDIANIVGGGTPSTKNKDFWNGKINWFTPTEVGENKYLFNSERKITEKGLEKSSATLLPINTILLTTRATIGRRSIILKKSTTNQGFQSLTIKNNSNVEFIYYLLDTLEKILLRKSCGSTFLELSKKELKKINIIIPIIEEQEKIADFLSAIDKKIELMEKKHTLYKNIKKYFLDNLFPHEKRDIPDLSFNEYSNIWKQIKLKQIIYKAKAGGTPKSSIKEYYNGNIPFLSINDMTNEGKYITYTEKSITEKGLKNSSAWLVPEKSLLYSMYASVGFVSINNIPLTTSQAIFNIIFKEQVSLEFMYYYLTFYKRYIHKYIETGTQGNLNAKLIKNFKIKIPSKEEQRKIADFLSLIDTYIEINKEKLNHLKQIKKGLLQKMFC